MIASPSLQIQIWPIDTKYADVIAQRWETLSGKKAKIEADARTFEEIAKERRPAA